MEQGKYVPINSQELEKRMTAIEDCWKDFFAELVKYYNEKEESTVAVAYDVNVLALREIVERVYQREDYFVRYHSGMRMSEFKEIGLYVFWMIKFKPFNINGKEYTDKFAFDINEEFALYYVFFSLKSLADELRIQYNSDSISQKLYDEMLYSLSFRDISKEAFGIIVELIARIVMPNLPN